MREQIAHKCWRFCLFFNTFLVLKERERKKNVLNSLINEEKEEEDIKK